MNEPTLQDLQKLIEELQKRIEVLEKWKEERVKQQLSYPLDPQSQRIIQNVP